MVVIIGILVVLLITALVGLIVVLSKARAILHDNDYLQAQNEHLRAHIDILNEYVSALVEELMENNSKPTKPNKSKHLTVVKGDGK